MKHHDVFRPVGKCKGCCLNLKVACAAHLEPKGQWSRGRCRNYGDTSLLEQSLNRQGLSGAKLARELRRLKTIENAAAGHYNGVLDPGKMAGRAKRAKPLVAR